MTAGPAHHDATKQGAAKQPAQPSAFEQAMPERPPTAGWLRMATRVGSTSPPSKGPCGCGDCVQCKHSRSVVGPADDAFEREADRLADRMVAGDHVAAHAHEAPVLRTKSEGSGSGASTATLPGLGAGRPLPGSIQAEFGPRLGRSLDGVRVHTDASAHAAASSLGARAFTLGRDVVFGAGEWSPITTEGRRLIAHELVHWAQQGGVRHAGGDRIQRRLKVETDAGSESLADSISTIRPLLDQICTGFTIHGNGEITADSATECGRGQFAPMAAANRVGCCCVCTLVRGPGTPWRIIVTTTRAPITVSAAREVRMTPSGANAPRFRYWSQGPERTVDLPPVEAFGHELCGHAALMQIQAHPPDTHAPDRAFSDVHDPAVKIENALAGEMGLAGPRRGLAGGGTHRGESLRVFTVQPFAAGNDDPTAAAASLTNATSFLNSNSNLLADVVGFRDAAEAVNVSIDRARRVQALLVAGVAPPTTSVEMTAGSGRVSLPRVQAASDGGVGSRQVEVSMAFRPAGLRSPPPPVPVGAPTHVGAEHQATAQQLVAGRGPNACHNLLARIAWAGATP